MSLAAAPDLTLRMRTRPVRWAGWLVAAFAAVVLVGWLAGLGALTNPMPGQASTKANTAVALLAVAAATLLANADRRSRAAAALAVVPLTIASLTLLQYAAGADLGIDQLLVEDQGADTPTPGRMSPLTAIALVGLALAILCARRDTPRAGAVREGLVASAALTSLAGLSAHAYGATLLQDATQMSAPTGLALLVAAVGVLLLGGEGPLARLVLDVGSTGQVARRLLPAAVLVPLFIGFVRIQLQDLGLVDTELGATIYAVSMVTVLVGGSLVILARLQRSQVERDRAQEAVEAATRRLEQTVRRTDQAEAVTGRGTWQWDVRADRAVWSPGMYRLFGLDPATFQNTNEAFLALVHPDDRAKLGQAMADAVAKPGRFFQEYRLLRPDGRLIHVRGEGNVVTGPEGRPDLLFGFVQDVTELRALEEARRAAEEAVQASERRLRLFFDANPSGLIISRADGTVVDLNRAAEHLWGRSRDEFFHPGFRMEQVYADPGERQKVVAEVQRQGGARDLELRMRRGDGSVRAMLFNIEVIELDGERVFLGAGQDITALREAEAQVRDSESRLRAVLDNASDAIITGDATATIVGWNRAAERIFGYASGEAIGKSIAALLPAEPWRDYEQDIAQFMQGKPSRYVGRPRELRALRKDGTGLDIELALAVWRAATGPMFTGVVRDITERKQAQEAVRRAQERFATVFQLSPVPISLTKEDGTFLDANQAFCELTGRSDDDLRSGAVRASELWEDPDERQRLVANLRERGLVRDLEVRIKRADGEVRTTLANVEFIDLGGRTTILTLLQDITERKRIEDERAARIATEAELERLRRTDRFRADFINNIAHELATPLTPLVLKAKTLVADRSLTPTQHQHAEAIERNVARLRRLVDDMVGAADLQARNLALDKRRLNLTRELRAAVAAHLPAAERAGLHMDEPEDSGLTVSADPARLQLVLGHLIGNAIKFTPSGGRVTVSSRRTGTGEVRIEVKDTGIGLTRKQIEGLWKPFGQAHDKSQRTDSGSGLGLYVSKGIVDLHGGEVGVASPGPGQGSTFWFTLPLATGHLDPLSRPKPESVDAGPRRNLNPGVADEPPRDGA